MLFVLSGHLANAELDASVPGSEQVEEPATDRFLREELHDFLRGQLHTAFTFELGQVASDVDPDPTAVPKWGPNQECR